MDANGTRYHLLLGRDDWGNCSLDEAGEQRLAERWRPQGTEPGELDWSNAAEELILTSQLFRFVAGRRARPVELADRRGAGRDRHGSWYWIAPSRQEILVNSSGSGRTSRFWSTADQVSCAPEPRFGEFGPASPAPPPAPLDLQGLAVTDDQYLVAGVLQPAGLLVFDLFAGGPPRQVLFPPEVGFAPFDLAARPGFGVWVLDRDNRRYWAFDAGINVVPREQPTITLEPGQSEDFQPVEASPPNDAGARRRAPRALPGGISLDAAFPLEVADPISIEGLPDGSVLILDHDPAARASRIYRMRFATPLGAPLSTDVLGSFIAPGLAPEPSTRGHDLAFVPAAGAAGTLGQLYVASADGDQTFVFDLAEGAGGMALSPLARYLPMRLFGGRAIVAGGGRVYYDSADRWLPLVEQQRPRHAEAATLYTPIRPRPAAGGGAAGGSAWPVLDGRVPDCTWHRLLLDACIPPGAEVAVASRAANDLAGLPLATWRAEPELYRRSDGSELAYAHRRGPYDTWELLFQRARGRYLQLRLTLRGTGQNTPRIRALRAYYPRFSYLERYLPAVYREDELPASFLDRFLANFEGVLTSIEDRIAAAQTLFDPRTAPQEALDWLASWFGVALDPAWDEARRRLFIRYATIFFRQRGTLNGLYMALQIGFGDCVDERLFSTPLPGRGGITAIRIIEQFRTRRTPSVVLGDPTSPAGLRVVERAARWTPAQGVAELQARYAEFVGETGPVGLAAAFEPVPPADAAAAAVWARFALEVLGFVPAHDAAEQGRWTAFLARRHGSVAALDDAYRLTGSARHASFAAVPQPSALPADGPALQDWYAFQSVVLPMRRAAHRFVVLLPMPRGGFDDEADRRDRLSLARRVVEMEKPAHTTFDVRFFWAMFRVGEARLGHDTLVERGSRSPELMTPMVLGQGHLMGSHLATPNVAPACRSFLAGDQR
jgi:phage tail-like protein